MVANEEEMSSELLGDHEDDGAVNEDDTTHQLSDLTEDENGTTTGIEMRALCKSPVADSKSPHSN